MKLVKGSTVLIPWSGGMDSTYLVYKAILAGCRVTTAYYKIENNDLKTKAELEARIPMIEYFYQLAREHNTRYSDLGVVFTVDVGHHRNHVGQFTQTPLWVLASAYCAADYDYVAMGFVQNDDTLSWLNEYTRLFNAYKQIQHDFVKPPKVKLIYPISKSSKGVIYHQLPSDLRNKTWTCEEPLEHEGKYYECGNCKPCKTHIANAYGVNHAIPVIKAEHDRVVERDYDSIETLQEIRTEVNKKIRALRKKSCEMLTVDEPVELEVDG